MAKGNTEFADASSHDNIRYIFVLLACIGVVLLNFFLINAPVGFIAEQFGDLWMARIATVTVPIFLLLLETRRRWAERQVIALVNRYHQTLADYNAGYPGHRLECGQYQR